jgi:hypothetical protein
MPVQPTGGVLDAAGEPVSPVNVDPIGGILATPDWSARRPAGGAPAGDETIADDEQRPEAHRPRPTGRSRAPSMVES